jgi:hypothetical protein
MTNIKYIVDVENNQIMEIEMTDAELKAEAKEQKIKNDLRLAKEAEAEAKAVEKQALLDRLGITANEAKLLLG